MPRYAVSVAPASSTLAPGRAIRLRLTVKALLPAPGTEIWLAMPELQAARRSGWGNEYRAPRGIRLAPVAAWQVSLAAGGIAARETTVVIPQPGYYRVVVTARGNGGGLERVDGRAVQDVVHEELWLLVDERGGAVTQRFDQKRLPPTVVGTSGPFRAAAREAPGPGSDAAPALPGDGPTAAALPLTGIPWDVSYYNADDGAYEPIGPGSVLVTVLDGAGGIVEWYHVPLASNGRVVIPCESGPYTYTADVMFDAADVEVNRYWSAGEFSGGYADCGRGPMFPYPFDGVDGEPARVFANMLTIIPEMEAKLGRSRGKIQVRAFGTGGSFYSPGGDSIRIDYDSVWGELGVYVAAHEYTHAMHWKGIEEPADYECTPPGHGFLEEENLSCAFVEGFAAFVGMWVGGDRLYASTQSR